jgi:pimeloyl-ACP methyl ester carboxylesterase
MQHPWSYVAKGGGVRRSDAEAVGEFAGEILAASGTLIREMHEGIAGRPFGALGVAATPVRFVHDGISHAVYEGVSGALRTASRVGARIVAGRADADGPTLTAGPRSSAVLGALNGLYGNHLAERGSDLALGMDVRREGADIPVTAAALAAAFPDATSRIVVFVHGLCETDDAWRLLPLGGARVGRRTYGERLQDELSFTPVYLRYNTGLRVSENGRALARLLDDLLAGWPTRVEDLVLVGHSVGGLVARSACHYGELDGRRWINAIRHVFCLGTPHLGADLEKGVNVLSWALGRLPETGPFATILNARSVGIKDLRFGSCVEEDWCDRDPDEFLRDRCQETPFLPDANYYFIGATLSSGPVGSTLGDLLVRMPSASGRGNGRGRSISFEVDNGRELAGLTHFALLNHPAVYEQIRKWITRPAARRALAAVPA